MPTIRFLIPVTALLCAVLLPPLAAKPTAPAWLQTAAALPVPSFDKKTKAVILTRAMVYDVRPDGVITSTERVAIRLLQPEGYSHATMLASYTADTGKIRTTLAWLIPPTGDVIAYGKKDFLETAPTHKTLFTDARLIQLSASGNAVTGSVFGYEISIEDHAVFSQLLESLQYDIPCLQQRVSVKLPIGWDLKYTFINHPETAPTTNDGYTNWSFTALPALSDEPAMPSIRSLSAYLGLDLIAPEKTAALERLYPYFKTWNDLSRYFTPRNDHRCIVDPSVTAKANELTQNAPTPLEIIKALGRYAQQINYTMISAKLGSGGGLIPQPAPATLLHNYGDCKDKANLLRALLRVKGIKAFPLFIYSGNNDTIWPQWPTPMQFNHAILAISVGPEIESPAIINHATLGRLLVFDPTDENVPVGQLPATHYGSKILLVAGDDGDLITLPPLPAQHNTVTQTIEASLDDRGQLTAQISEQNNGETAAGNRQEQHTSTPIDYAKNIASWINIGVRNAKITDLKTEDDFDRNRFTIRLKVTAPAYAQSLRGKLLIFKPSFIPPRHMTDFTEKERTQPAVFSAANYVYRTTINLPASYAIDEFPKSVDLKSQFAHYQSHTTVENGILTRECSLQFATTKVPAADYAKVRNFFEQVIKAEQASVVLQRKAKPAPQS